MNTENTETTENTQPTHDEIQDRYLAKVNALVATDREYLIPDITAEYTLLLDGNAELDQHAAA